MKKAFSVALLLCIASAAQALIVYRPSNYGTMDTVRCYIRICDADGTDVTYTSGWANYSWYDMPRRRHPYQNSWFLSGGMAMHLHLKPGTYTISVYTPVEQQPLYLEALELPEKKEWVSNTFTYDTSDPQLKVIFVSPTADDGGFYDGGWHIDYRAPRFYEYTKPFRPGRQ